MTHTFVFFQQSLPIRHKEFHLVNIPSGIKYIVDFAMSKVSSKMTQRLNVRYKNSNLQNNMTPDIRRRGFLYFARIRGGLTVNYVEVFFFNFLDSHKSQTTA